MRILIEPVESAAQVRAAARIREEVFGREWGCTVASPENQAGGGARHLLARTQPGGRPVATLSLVDTSTERELHATYKLPFESGATVARYTQLAVLRPYRGLHVGLRLIAEAHRQFVIPANFDYTWLLFDAARARSSSLCNLLGFRVFGDVFSTTHGPMRALVRSERIRRFAGSELEVSGVIDVGWHIERQALSA